MRTDTLERYNRELANAHSFYADEHLEYGMNFDHDACVEDIHRMYGITIAKAVHNTIAKALV